MMKILFYNHTGKVSGAERLLLMILAGLDRGVIDPVVACPEQESLAKLVSDLDVRVETVPGLEARFTWRVDQLVRYLGSFYQVISQVRRTITRVKPDLIHANSIRSGLVATAATIGLGTRVVWHLHDLLPRHPLSTLIRAFAVLSRRTHMIAVSQAVAENFCGAFVPLRGRVSVILNAIDLELFHPEPTAKQEKRAELQLNNADPLIGIVGLITPRKGQLELLHAFAKVLIDLPAAVLLIVGAPLFNRDQEYLDLLNKGAAELGIAKSVRMLGARSDVAAIMQALDLLVVNSSAEPFGLVALEAMACSTPVLAAATGGLKEIIQHGKDGWLVPLRNEQALATAIVNLSRQPQLRASLASEGRRTVTSRFGSDRYLQEFQNFYLKLRTTPLTTGPLLSSERVLAAGHLLEIPGRSATSKCGKTESVGLTK
jgi:glycosyltransferase involved in cell wall biosynthesis